MSARCYCACHQYPGTYHAKPCSHCGHHNSRGHFPGPAFMGWEPCSDPLCHLHGGKAILEAARSVVRCWDAVVRCVDEFEPEDMGACGETRDALDTALIRLKDVLAAEAAS